MNARPALRGRFGVVLSVSFEFISNFFQNFRMYAMFFVILENESLSFVLPDFIARDRTMRRDRRPPAQRRGDGGANGKRREGGSRRFPSVSRRRRRSAGAQDRRG